MDLWKNENSDLEAAKKSSPEKIFLFSVHTDLLDVLLQVVILRILVCEQNVSSTPVRHTGDARHCGF